jgi:hypothetical protein
MRVPEFRSSEFQGRNHSSEFPVPGCQFRGVPVRAVELGTQEPQFPELRNWELWNLELAVNSPF